MQGGLRAGDRVVVVAGLVVSSSISVPAMAGGGLMAF